MIFLDTFSLSCDKARSDEAICSGGAFLITFNDFHANEYILEVHKYRMKFRFHEIPQKTFYDSYHIIVISCP